MTALPPLYSPRSRACLLRVWATDGEDGAVCWRFSLQDVESGERRGFSDFDSLTAYLRQWLETVQAPALQEL